MAFTIPGSAYLIQALVRGALGLALEGWGYDVGTAAGMADAIALVGEGFHPDVVLADYRLGEGVTSVDVIAAVLAMTGPGIPAAIVTGDAAQDRTRQAEASGMAIFHKPIFPDALQAFGERSRRERSLCSGVEWTARIT